MIVSHRDEQQRKPEDAAERRRCKCPLIDRDSEKLEHRIAECHVRQGEQNFHEWPPVPGMESALAIAWYLGSPWVRVARPEPFPSRQLKPSTPALVRVGPRPFLDALIGSRVWPRLPSVDA